MVAKKGWIFGGDNVARLIGNRVRILVNNDVARNWGWMMVWKDAARN